METWEELAALSMDGAGAPDSAEAPAPASEQPAPGPSSPEKAQPPNASAPADSNANGSAVEVDIALKQALNGDSRAWGERRGSLDEPGGGRARPGAGQAS